jgi:hypothetical protein
MHLLISPTPSPTATSSCCPQCAAVMSIRLVEPDLKDPLKARHVFECQECGLSRAYLMIADQSTPNSGTRATRNSFADVRMNIR